MKKISVLVVDDSAFMRRMITDMILQDETLEVIAAARNGADALAKYEKLNPDIVTLDIELPDINGLELLTKMLEIRKKPVIMLSTLTQKGAETTFEAMNRGAVDFISKPSGAISLDISKIQKELVEKIKLSVNANVKEPQVKRAEPMPIKVQNDLYQVKEFTKSSILFIGSSTGGPSALQEVIPRLPKDFPASVLVVQHMPPKFTKSLADRLNHLSALEVKEAVRGDRIEKGRVYLAPGGFHMKVKAIHGNLTIDLTEEPTIHGVRPSCDALLTSLEALEDFQIMTVILTGMGKDGTDGLASLKKVQNVFSIAESEKTSVVFGMPKSIILSGLADCVRDLEDIPSEICRQLYEKRS